MSKSVLGTTSLEFDTLAGTRKVIITADTSSLDFEGNSAADVNLTGIANIGVSGQAIFYDRQLAPNTKSITLTAPSVVGTSYSLTLPPAQGATNSYLRNNGGGSLTWETIPITSFSYRFVRATTDQTSIGSLVTFEGTSTGEGTLPFASGVFTLSANKTYYLQGTVDQLTASSATFSLNYRWKDVTNNAFIGVAGTADNPANFGTTTNTIAYGVISPTTSVNVRLEIVSNTNVTSILGSATGGPAALVYEIITGTGTIGDVVGPAVSTDKALVRFSGTSGKIIQNSNVLLTDADALQDITSLRFKQSTNTVTLTPSSNAITFSGVASANVSLGGLDTLTMTGSLILTETTGLTNTITIKAPATVTASYALTMPAAQGAAGTYLRNDGTGALTWAAISGTGDVVGPASATDNALARFNLATGKLIKNSVAVLTDTGDLSGLVSVALSGATSGSLKLQPAATTTSYTLTMPAAQGAADTFLKNDGTGVLTWATAGSGSVSGPGSSTDNALARYDGTTGKIIKNSTAILTDAGALSGLISASFLDSGSNTATINTPTTITSNYTLTLPTSQSTSSKTSALYNDGTGALSWQTDPVSFQGTTPVAYLIPVFADSTGRKIKRIIGSLSLTDTDDIQNISQLQFNKDNIYIGTDPVRANTLTISNTVDPSTAININGIKSIYFDGSLVFGVQPGFRGTAYPINFPASAGTVGDILILSNASTGQLSWSAGTTGSVIGPASSTDTALVRFDGTTGKLVKNSGVTLTDTSDMVGVKTLGLSGSTSGILTLQPAASVTDYTIKLPSSQGASGQVMINDGSGNLVWGDRSNISGIGVYGYYNTTGGWDGNRRMNLNITPIVNTDVTQIFVTANILALEPGTWEVTAVWQGTQSAGTSTVQWYNELGLSFVGNSCICAAANSTSTYNPGNIVVYSFTTATSVQLSVRDTGSGTLQPAVGYSYIYVRKLNDTPFNPAPTTEYLMGCLTADVTTNLSAGDHIKFNSLLNGQSSNGTTNTGYISLDTTTAYTSATNVASLGRLTLNVGRTFELTGYAQGVATNATGTFSYAWYNADSNTQIGTTGTYYPNRLAGTVTVGDIGGGTSGSITCSGNILTATKTNGNIGGTASTIVVTYPSMGVTPVATVMPMDAGGSPITQDNDAGYPVISTISATSLTFWVEDGTTSTENMLYGIIIEAPSTGGPRSNSPSKAIFKPLSNTRVELRIVSGAMSTNYASDTYLEAVMLIGDPNTLPFTGATASSAGSQGLVPTPAAGQQNNFLRGDATWANATSNSTGASTANSVARFDGTSGNYIKPSGLAISDTADLTGAKTIAMSGATSGSLTMQTAAITTSYAITMPSAQGSSGSVLTNNGSGTLTWSLPTTGDVFGPSTATSNAVARFDTSTGKLIKNSLAVLSDTGDISGLRSVAMSGSSSGSLTLKPAAATSSYTLTMPAGQGTSGQILTNDGTGVLSWTTSGAGTGDVTGPASSTDNALARYDGTTGKIVKNSGVTLSDTADLVGVKTLAMSGATSGTLTIAPGATTTSYSITLPSAQGGTSTYLQNNGTGTLSWASGTSGNLLNVQTFISAPGTFTYTPTVGTKRALVYVIGGGGAGGGALSGTNKSAGCGGTGGGCQVGLFAIDTSLTGTVVVGAGGTGVTGAAGNAGSASTFTFSGSTITGNGGAGGTLAQSAGLSYIVQPNIVAGTSTAINTVLLNTYTMYGSLGARGEIYNVSNTLITGAGGNSAFGGGANVNSANATSVGGTGNAGTNGVGGGGSGGYQTNNTTQAGGAGGFGGVYVFEYTDQFGGSGGDVDGPTGATANAIARFNGVSGKLIQNSSVTLSDTADIAGVKTLSMAGATSGSLTVKPAATTTSYTITMPGAQGSADSYLKNDGSGTLSWSSTVGGDVYGPASATNNAITRFDTTTGKLVKNSTVTLSDTADFAGVKTIGLAGATSGVTTLKTAATVTNYTVTLPQNQGLSGQILSNDGSGNLSWVNQSSTGIATYSYYNCSGNWDVSRRMNLNSTPVINTDVTQMSVTSNVITLAAGTWELTAVWQGTNSAGGATIQWYNETTSGFVGNQCGVIATNSTSPQSNGNILVYSVILASSGNFSIRDTGSGNLQPTAINSYIYAKKLTDTPYNPAPTTEYLMGCLTANVTTNLSTGDHIKFNSLSFSQSSNGTTNTGNISLDTTTAYTTTANVASLGRVTLKAGRTYDLTGYVQGTPTTSSSTFSYAWYNADSGTQIGTNATYFPNVLSGSVTIGDIGGGTSGSITCTGNILTATKTNGNIGAAASTIVITYPNMGVTPSATIALGDASGSPSTNDNDVAQPVISVISATGLTFWIEETSGTQNIIAYVTISVPSNGGMRPNGVSKSVYAPLVDTRVELRIVTGTMSINYYSETYMQAVMLIGAPNTLPFNGATAGAAGSQGLVPVPAAGKQNSFLRGDSTWQVVPFNSTGSSTDNALVRFDGTSGAAFQNSLAILSDTGDLTGLGSVALSGSVSGAVTLRVPSAVTSYTITLPSAQGAANSVLTNDGTGIVTWSASYVRSAGGVTDRTVAIYSGTTGTLVQSSPVTVSALGEIGAARSLTFAGSTSGTLALVVPSSVTSYTITLPAGQGASNTTLVNNGSGGLSWQAASTITGPATSTDTAIVRWSGATGRIIQDSGVLISATNAMTGVASLALKGTTNSVTISPAAATAAYALTLPAAQGAANSVLQNDGSGGLSWGTPGNVVGPASATDSALARFDLTTGKLIKNSVAVLTDAGSLSGLKVLVMSGATSGTLTLQPAATTTNYTLTLPSAQGSANTVLTNNGSGTLTWGVGGNVTGPASATNNALVRWDLASGTLIKNSTAILTDAGGLSGLTVLALSGATSGTLTVQPAATTTSYTVTMPAVQGASGSVPTNNGSGTLTWAVPGNVTGPGSSTDKAMARFSGTTGQVLQNSVVTVSDVGELAQVRSLTLAGATSGTLAINPSTTTTSYTVTMPSAQGTAGTVLKNDGSGNLTWGTAGSITGPATSTDTALVRWNGTGGTALSDSGVTLSATQDLVGAKTLGLAGATSGTLTLKPAATTTSYTLTMPGAQGSSGQVLVNNGSGVLSWGAGGGGGGSSDYMIGNMTATVFTNLLVGDHAPFNQAYQSTNGTASTTNITLDTTSAYSSATNTASIGRITLKANSTYTIMGIIKSLAGVDYYGYAWYDSDTNTRIGTRGEGFASTSQAASTSSNPSYCTITPIVDTRVELRLTESSTGSIVNWYSGSTGYGETMFNISVATAATSSVVFTGATASVAGTIGLVTAPAAGQQLSFLRGDATWSGAVYNQTTVQRNASTPVTGIPFFNTTNSQLEYYNGTNYLTNSLVTITTTGQTGSLTNDIVIFNPPSSTALTYTLPDPTVTYGKTITYRISKSVAALNASVVLTAPGSNTVDGAATFTLACIGDFVTLVSNGTDWVVTNKPTGLLPLANTTVTAATAVTYDNMFHSKYSAYVIEVYLKNAGGTGGYTNTWRLRSGGATVTGANYTSFGRYVGSGIGSQADFTANTNETSWGGSANMYNFTGAGDYISITGEIVNPTSNTIATRLTLNGPYTYGGGVFASYANGFYKDVTQVADGWVYTSVSGTVSGNVKVYARCVL